MMKHKVYLMLEVRRCKGKLLDASKRHRAQMWKGRRPEEKDESQSKAIGLTLAYVCERGQDQIHLVLSTLKLSASVTH